MPEQEPERPGGAWAAEHAGRGAAARPVELPQQRSVGTAGAEVLPGAVAHHKLHDSLRGLHPRFVDEGVLAVRVLGHSSSPFVMLERTYHGFIIRKR